MNDIYSIDVFVLKTFDLLMQNQSVTQTAQWLGVTQPATSHNLNKLRKLFADPLFVRIGKKMIPTDKATSMHASVRTAILKFEAIFEQNLFDPLTSSKVFNLGTTDYFEGVCLPAIINNMTKLAPGITIKGVLMHDDFEQMSLSNDLAFGNFQELPNDYHEKTLWHEEFRVICSNKHPRIKDQTMDLDAYLSEKHLLISHQGKLTGMVDTHLKKLGRTRNVQYTTNGFLSPGRIVSQSDVIATVPQKAAELFAQENNIQIIKPPLALPGYDFKMIWSALNHHQPEHIWLRKTVEKILKNR